MSIVKVSAPGSLMLTGEHAVIHGYPACVCAVNKRLYLEAEILDEKKLYIESPLGNFETELENLTRSDKFTFITEAVRLADLKKGIRIKTESEFSHKTGLGSSAAVTVCTCKALDLLSGRNSTKEELFRQSLKVVRSVQKTGSGSDIAASVFGGITKMEAFPSVLHCTEFPEIDLFYCGYKMKTPDVIALVNSLAEKNRKKYDRIYREMGETANLTAEALESGDLIQTGKLFDRYQVLMEELGVCDSTLKTMIETLKKEKNVLGVKISGSGLGDCVMTLGIPEKKLEGYLNIPVKITREGVKEC